MFKNRLDRTFEELKSQNKLAFVAYLAAGYPAFPDEEKLIQSLKEGGVNVLELGIPFSDPIADGPTIQFASQEALKGGASLRKIFNWINGFKTTLDLPIVLMSYINPVMQYGFEAFAKDARAAGVTGVIFPDMIPEEADEIEKVLAEHEIHTIYLVAPTTPKDRQKLIAKRTGGFLYAVSVTGVTGARAALPPETKSWLASLRKISKAPVCVGFGISGPEPVRELKDSVDGFIVGSAFIDLIRKNHPGKRQKPMRAFVRSLSKECRRGR